MESGEVKKDDLELKELNQFYGTQGYHAGFLGVKLTDGVAYVSENGYSWLVTDFISVAKTKLKGSDFLCIELILGRGKAGVLNNTAQMHVTDGDGAVLYEQEYGFTDAKRGFKMFYTDGVLMLAGEY